MLSAQVICSIYLLSLLTNVSIEAKGRDLDQTVPVEQKSYKTLQQTTKAEDICCDWCFNSKNIWSYTLCQAYIGI